MVAFADALVFLVLPLLGWSVGAALFAAGVFVYDRSKFVKWRHDVAEAAAERVVHPDDVRTIAIFCSFTDCIGDDGGWIHHLVPYDPAMMWQMAAMTWITGNGRHHIVVALPSGHNFYDIYSVSERGWVKSAGSKSFEGRAWDMLRIQVSAEQVRNMRETAEQLSASRYSEHVKWYHTFLWPFMSTIMEVDDPMPPLHVTCGSATLAILHSGGLCQALPRIVTASALFLYAWEAYSTELASGLGPNYLAPDRPHGLIPVRPMDREYME